MELIKKTISAFIIEWIVLIMNVPRTNSTKYIWGFLILIRPRLSKSHITKDKTKKNKLFCSLNYLSLLFIFFSQFFIISLFCERSSWIIYCSDGVYRGEKAGRPARWLWQTSAHRSRPHLQLWVSDSKVLFTL